MDFTIALISLALGTTIGKGAAQYFGMEGSEQQIQLQTDQQTLQYQQKTLQNYELTNQILDKQLAQATTRGIGLGSPSLQAIQAHTTDISAKNQRNLDTEEDIFERNAAIEKSNVQIKFASQIFGDAASLATDIIGTKAKMPSYT